MSVTLINTFMNTIPSGGGGLEQTEVDQDTLTATGAEDDVINTDGLGKYEGYIDLTAMQAGDAVTIREYIKVKPAGNFILYAETSYSAAQDEPLIHIVRKFSEHGIQVTLEQTAGVNRDYDYDFWVEANA